MSKKLKSSTTYLLSWKKFEKPEIPLLVLLVKYKDNEFELRIRILSREDRLPIFLKIDISETFSKKNR